jgi:hypothetical protein
VDIFIVETAAIIAGFPGSSAKTSGRTTSGPTGETFGSAKFLFLSDKVESFTATGSLQQLFE